MVPTGSDEGWETRRGMEESRVMGRTKGLVSQMGDLAGGVAAIGVGLRARQGAAGHVNWERTVEAGAILGANCDPPLNSRLMSTCSLTAALDV